MKIIRKFQTYLGSKRKGRQGGQGGETVLRLLAKLDNRLSCAELAQANHQSLFVNQRVAAEAADYLLRLTPSHNLKRFATYFDLSAGSCRSTYVTPDNVRPFAKSVP